MAFSMATSVIRTLCYYRHLFWPVIRFLVKKTLLTPESVITATGHIVETQTEESSHQTAFLWFLQSKDKTDTADAPFQSRE